MYFILFFINVYSWLRFFTKCSGHSVHRSLRRLKSGPFVLCLPVCLSHFPVNPADIALGCYFLIENKSAAFSALSAFDNLLMVHLTAHSSCKGCGSLMAAQLYVRGLLRAVTTRQYVTSGDDKRPPRSDNTSSSAGLLLLLLRDQQLLFTRTSSVLQKQFSCHYSKS